MKPNIYPIESAYEAVSKQYSRDSFDMDTYNFNHGWNDTPEITELYNSRVEFKNMMVQVALEIHEVVSFESNGGSIYFDGVKVYPFD